MYKFLGLKQHKNTMYTWFQKLIFDKKNISCRFHSYFACYVKCKGVNTYKPLNKFVLSNLLNQNGRIEKHMSFFFFTWCICSAQIDNIHVWEK